MSALAAASGLGDTFDLAALAAARLQTSPYTHLVVPGCIRADVLAAINRDYPTLPGPGAHAIEQIQLQGAAAAFWGVLNGSEFRACIADKFGLLLDDAAIMGTMRSEAELADGAIHTDSRTKIITILFYFNETWPHAGGRLRLLRSGTNLEDFAAEVEPSGGTMLAFQRSDTSWHGHLPFTGPRRTLQMHYADAKRIARNAEKRKSITWRLKKLFSLG